jgi:hypothetical protein
LQPAWDLALLAPARTCGFAADPALREQAAARALATWLAGGYASCGEEASARLSGVLGAEAVAQLGAALRGDEAVPGEDAIAALLKSQPFALAAAPLLAAALDERVHPSVRGDLAVHLLLAQGRPALHALAPALHPAQDDRFLRQAFTAWKPIAAAEDVALLERLAREAGGSGAQYALQLWARLEREPARRAEIYELAIAAPGGYSAMALEALAEGGPDEEIAARLRSLLRAGTATQRGTALRALARFGSHEAVLAEYRALGAPLSVAAASWWMPVLAQSPLPAAQQAAADWLAAGGIGSGATAQTVVRALSEKEAVLPLLGALLGAPDVPMREKLPLAMVNAERSEDALEYLRREARTGEGLSQAQAVRRIGACGTAQDLAWLETLARSPEVGEEVRAVAYEALVLRGAAGALTEEWLRALPSSWERREAVLRLAIARGDEAQRERALALAHAGAPEDDAETRGALRGVAWSAIAERGDPALFERLAADWIELLERLEAEGRAGEDDWRDLFERLHAWTDLESCARAAQVLAPGVPERPASAALRAWDPYRTAPEALWAACALWSGVDARQTAEWLDALDALPLTEANRIRVRALAAARAPDPVVERARLRLLLGDPQALRRHPIYLAQAFTPEGARWTLFHDRLAEREVLADARMQPPAQGLRLLTALESGYVEGDLLARAAAFAAGEPGGKEIALRLAERGASLHPLHPESARLRAELLEDLGRTREAREAWTLLTRLQPPGYALHERARERLGALPD